MDLKNLLIYYILYIIQYIIYVYIYHVWHSDDIKLKSAQYYSASTASIIQQRQIV